MPNPKIPIAYKFMKPLSLQQFQPTLKLKIDVLKLAHPLEGRLKRIIWNKKAKEFVGELSRTARIDLGATLRRLQKGISLGFPQTRPMNTISKQAYELRFKDEGKQVRVIYCLILESTILIPHAFYKKSQKTPKKEIENAKRRLKELENEIR